MANETLKGETKKLPQHLIDSINVALSGYKKGGNTSGLKRANELVSSKMISYERMKQLKTFLSKASKGDEQEYKLCGGSDMLKFVDETLKTMRDTVDHVKRTIMNTGGVGGKKGGNAYKDTHHKKDNANPTGVSMPVVHKGSVRDQITNNSIQYESYDAEIESVRYLIEYMDNNKKDKII